MGGRIEGHKRSLGFGGGDGRRRRVSPAGAARRLKSKFLECQKKFVASFEKKRCRGVEGGRGLVSATVMGRKREKRGDFFLYPAKVSLGRVKQSILRTHLALYRTAFDQ